MISTGRAAGMLEQGDIIWCYRMLLRRHPQPAELRFWTSAHARTRSRADLIDTLIVQATEVRSMARLYLGLFQRMPELGEGGQDEEDGFTYWLRVLRTFRDKHKGIGYRSALTYSIEDWLNTEEYKSRFPDQLSVHAFIEQTFCGLAGRQPTSVETEHWSMRLRDPRHKSELVVAIAESQESKARFNPAINSALRDLARR